MEKTLTPSDIGKALNTLRNSTLSAEKRSEIARAAVSARWKHQREAIAEQQAGVAHHRKGMRSGKKKSTVAK